MQDTILGNNADDSTGNQKTDEDDEIVSEQILDLLHEAKDTDRLIPSPRNLDILKSTKIDLPPLKWFGHTIVPTKMKVTNTGRTVILSAKWDVYPYITGGPLIKSGYVFSDLHFHWGKSSQEGSEHLIEGHQSPLEMHVMYTKKDYRSQFEATKRDDGIVMVVYLFDVRFHDNPVLQRFLVHLENIRQANTDFHIKPFDISRLVVPFENEYYAYWGSIASKGEIYSALWIVCRQLHSVSFLQLHHFHKLLDPSLRTISRNWRPVTSEDAKFLLFVNPGNCIHTMSTSPISYTKNNDRTTLSDDSKVDKKNEVS